MRTRLVIAILAMIALPAYAPIPFPKPEKKEKEGSFQGTWTVERRSLGGNGKVAVAALPYQMKARIEGEKWTYIRTINGESRALVPYIVVLDPKKHPKWIDLRRSATGAPYIRGIYTIEGDTLTIVYVSGTRERPTNVAEPGRSEIMMVLKRDKP
jgi:uncharacterized protein (TIGR03067 family)